MINWKLTLLTLDSVFLVISKFEGVDEPISHSYVRPRTIVESRGIAFELNFHQMGILLIGNSVHITCFRASVTWITTIYIV
jgi:hypothetical protein